MPKSHNKEPDFYALRIHNEKTIQLINELAEKFDNRNAVLNEALNLGMPALYARVFGKEIEMKKEEQRRSPSTEREIKELRKVIDDVFIQMISIETMLAGLFNARTAELDGDDSIAERLHDGSLCALPELIDGLKSDLMRQRSD